MIKVAIAGGTGYTAGELLRILMNHPGAEVVGVLSTTRDGETVASVHRDLLGDTGLTFTSGLSETPDALLLALGHGLSRGCLDGLNLSPECRVIDLGNDFRTEPAYNGDRFVYGLSEVNHAAITAARYVANPGCFATSILLPLAPLSKWGLLTEEAHIHAITGSTGAGKSLSGTGHFSYRDNNISAYKPFVHQHLGEIGATLAEVSGRAAPRVNFVPMRGDFTRGIFTSMYTKKPDAIPLPELVERYKSFYENSPFVHISDCPVSMKEVVNTNKALIHIAEHDGYLHFTSVIDNLLKGAAGQAVQNMNLMFGLDEVAGLRLKGSAF